MLVNSLQTEPLRSNSFLWVPACEVARAVPTAVLTEFILKKTEEITDIHRDSIASPRIQLHL